jgi:hypothetical protein
VFSWVEGQPYDRALSPSLWQHRASSSGKGVFGCLHTVVAAVCLVLQVDIFIFRSSCFRCNVLAHHRQGIALSNKWLGNCGSVSPQKHTAAFILASTEHVLFLSFLCRCVCVWGWGGRWHVAARKSLQAFGQLSGLAVRQPPSQGRPMLTRISPDFETSSVIHPTGPCCTSGHQPIGSKVFSGSPFGLLVSGLSLVPIALQGHGWEMAGKRRPNFVKEQ